MFSINSHFEPLSAWLIFCSIYCIVVLLYSIPRPPLVLLKSNIKKIIILLEFILISCFIIDLTEFCFEVTSKILFFHNFPDHYGKIPTSLLESIFAIGWSVVFSMIFPCIVVFILTWIMTSFRFPVKSFSNNLVKIWVTVAASIWLFVLLNGLGIMTQYVKDPVIGHKLIYFVYPCTFIFTYIFL